VNKRTTIAIGGVEFNLQLTLIIVLSTVLAMIDSFGYSPTGIKAYDRFIFYFIIPMAVILLLFREKPAAYGFRIGNWRTGLLFTVAGIVGMAVILLFLARSPSMESYYSARAPEDTLYLLWITAVEYSAWEFMWRGFLLFGLASFLGPGPAIWLQAVPFAFMHLGKPEFEALTTIFGGAAFGYVAWKSRSFLYPFFIHWFMIAFTYLLVTGRIG
jgi:membrane protease YdiL (CAAX protease family)